MKIVIAGGSGFLGQSLLRYFKNGAHTFVVLTRNKSKALTNVREVLWNARDVGSWASELEDADVIINLCGKSVDCRYTEKNKSAIYTSRLLPTAAIGRAIQLCRHPPRVWINASSATVYRASYLKKMDERGDLGDDFSENVCKKWEQTMNEFDTPVTRKLTLRIAIALGKNEGAFVPLNRLAKFGFGGRQGKGNQLMSWIHIQDFCRTIDWLIDRQDSEGIYNVVSPETVSNHSFMTQLRNTMKVPFGIPMPVWLLELGAIFIRTETELILKSRNAYPARLLGEGFTFHFPTLASTLDDLCRP